MVSEVEQLRQFPGGTIGVPRVLEARVRVAQLVEERVSHSLDRRESLSRRVFEQLGDEVDSRRLRLPEDLKNRFNARNMLSGLQRGTDLLERMRLDLRELVLHVVGVHGPDLVPRGCAEHLDDLDELVDA